MNNQRKVEINEFSTKELSEEIDRRAKIKHDIDFDVRTYQFRHSNINECCRCPFIGSSGGCGLHDWDEVMSYEAWTTEKTASTQIPEWCPLVEITD